MREITNRTLNARAIQEGLGLFKEIWERAMPEERKELMRFYVYKVIFTYTEVSKPPSQVTTMALVQWIDLIGSPC